MKLLFSILILILTVGCASPDNSHKDYLIGSWEPSFEIDDIKDGVFPNKSPRTGENAYAFRGNIGVQREYKDGSAVYIKGGPRNRHVGGVEIGFKKRLP